MNSLIRILILDELRLIISINSFWSISVVLRSRRSIARLILVNGFLNSCARKDATGDTARVEVTGVFWCVLCLFVYLGTATRRALGAEEVL
jgi:hypothetical protein